MEVCLVTMSKFVRSSVLRRMTTAFGLALCARWRPACIRSRCVQMRPSLKTAAVETEDEIVVSGFRKALENAQDIKARCRYICRCITAEDIGALPDRSVAEALQRVPGVNIGRLKRRLTQTASRLKALALSSVAFLLFGLN